MLFLLLACTTLPSEPQTCEDLLDGGPPASTEAELQVLLDEVHQVLFPELAGVSITLTPNSSETSYFSANPDLASVADPPLERDYLVQYSTRQFDSPPPADAVTAILVHELKHVRDYTEMDQDELVAFGVRYLTEPISAYERQTDEHALELGCADGLILFREWLYDNVTDEVEAQKRIDYYTPDEIRAWVEAREP